MGEKTEASAFQMCRFEAQKLFVKYQENNENEDEINRTIFLQVGVGENY